jgi:hypothetical protein
VKILELARKLPVSDEENNERINHAYKHGHVLKLFEKGDCVGYAECYVLKEIPKSFPVYPWPKNELGSVLYCFAVSCEKNRIRGLIKLAQERFPHCKRLAYHRLKRRNKIHIEELHNV